MARIRLWGLLLVAVMVALWATGAENAQAVGLPPSDPTINSDAFGEAAGVVEHEGRLLLVELFLSVPPDENEEEIIRQALDSVGARPITVEDAEALGFVVSAGGLRWDRLSDRRRNNDSVVQYYNPANDPTDGGAQQSLLNSHGTWNDVHTSSFRFKFGGLTDRGLQLVDGFNDMAWEDLGLPFILGLTFTAFDNFDEPWRPPTAIAESDVLMNTAASAFRQGWSTDGGLLDVESVMLHEAGHVMGLGHSLALEAVMYWRYLGPRRELALDDIAGASYLYPFASARMQTAPPSSSGPFRLVAQLGDEIYLGEASSSFVPGNLNDRGDVSFSTLSLCPGGGCLPGDGAYSKRMDELTEIARAVLPAPGGGVYWPYVYGLVDNNGMGNAAFAFSIDRFRLPWGRNAGVFYYERASGETEALMRPYETQAPGADGPFVGAVGAVLNDLGLVAFGGMTETHLGPGAPLGMGVYLFDPMEGLEAVAVPGSAAPGGGTFVQANWPSLNDQGDVAFEGLREGEPCLAPWDTSLQIDCLSGVYVWSAGTGEIRRIAGMGDIIGGDTLRAAVGATINRHGHVVFAGDLTPAPDVLQDVGLFLAAPDGTVVPIVQPGDEMPGGGTFVRAAIGPPGYSINDRGEVAFAAILDTHSFPFIPGASSDMGIYVWRDGKIRLVARTGSIVPGMGVITSLFPPFQDSLVPQISGGMVNNHGEVLFQATVLNSDFELNGVLLVGTVAPADVCYDGLDPAGEDLAENGFETPDLFIAQLFGWLCTESPSDLFLANVEPHPVVAGGQTLTSVALFDPALGDISLELFLCDDQDCTQRLEPEEVPTPPGVRVARWRNTTDEVQRVAVKVSLARGSALPYVFQYYVDLGEP